jgi:hypothetical protein
MRRNILSVVSVVGGLAVSGFAHAEIGVPSAWLISAQAGAAASIAQSDEVTKDGIITGTMDISFNTRTTSDTSGDLKEGSPAVGAKYVYKFNMIVADTTRFSGEVTRQPNLYTKSLGRRKQDAELYYSVDLSVRSTRDLKQEKTIGKWVGTVPIETTSGAFDLAGGKSKESALRIAVDAAGRAAAFTEHFRGKLVGKAENKESLASSTFKRIIGGRTVQIKVLRSDPMRFDNLVLAKGPAENYPTTTVSGRLDYDYETGNWYTDGVRFTYSLDGRDFEDVMTGSIKWVEDPDRATNGKGYYDFNLRFNEEKHKKSGTEEAAFETLSDEDAFFAIDDSVPAMSGRVSYADTMSGETVTASKVTYSLNANKLTKQQVMNFFKMWMIAVGPINDE